MTISTTPSLVPTAATTDIREAAPQHPSRSNGSAPPDERGGLSAPLIAQRFLDPRQITVEETPAVPWAIDGLVAEQDFTFVSGIGGIGKSYVAISTAISLASGRPLFGHFGITRNYRVLYLDMEMSEWETHRRFSRMLRGAGLAGAAAPENLLIAARGTLLLDSLASVKELERLIEQAQIDFIIVDSYRRIYLGDDKESQNSNRVFKVLSGLRARFGVGFIFVAHWRKKSVEDALNDPKERLMGTVDQRNMIDCHISVEYGGEDNTLKIGPDKGRHGDAAEEGFRIRFKHDDAANEDGPFVLEYIDVDSTKREKSIIDAIIAIGQDNWTTPGKIAESSGLKPKTVQRGLKRLLLANIIERRQIGGRWCIRVKPAEGS